MCTPADTSGAARIRPIIPNRQPPPIVAISTTSGLRPSVAPNAIGCTICWSMPLASRTMTAMTIAAVSPCPASASATANAPPTHAPMNGTYAPTNVTTAIVPASGTPRISAPSPITMALNAATIVTPRKYWRRARSVSPVTTSATGSGSPMCPLSQRRIDGPSLSRKNVLKTANESVKNSDVSPLMPSATPFEERLADLRHGALDVAGRTWPRRSSSRRRP